MWQGLLLYMNAECFFGGGNRRHARKGDCLGLDTLNVKNWVDHMVDQNCTYLFQRRSTYYYSRRVPKELQPKIGRQRIVVSLKTRSLSKANRFGQLITQKLDEDWLFLRLGKQLGVATGSTQVLAPTLSATLKHYLQLPGKDKSKKEGAARRPPKIIIV